MNEKTRKKIIEMQKKGMTTYAIAKQLGLSQTGVKYVLDPKYREHMKQISRERSSKPKSPQPNNAISSSDIAWLSQHRKSVEHRVRMLKSVGISTVYFALAFAFVFASITFVASFTTLGPNFLTSASSAFAIISSGLALALLSVITPDEYDAVGIAGIISGFIIGLILANLILALL